MAWKPWFDEREVGVDITARRPSLRVRIGETTHEVEEGAAAEGRFELRVDGGRYRGWRWAAGDAVYVRLNGRTFEARLPRRAAGGEAAGARDAILASMPGVVVAVECAPGQAVEAGERLLTIESMKLQMTIVASHAATVAAVPVAAGSAFERGAPLVRFVADSAVKP
ncbi:MAG TPA: biotin/lipoyl-containing protein [Steroidobacteraceae bacterium]|nr:biotin/lipoyl-containing protein [Steroidobacteraceae bacterium]